jgi:glycosyltransferase involved in cell wall biosynthesis
MKRRYAGDDALVSIGLPVHNGESTVATAVRSVLDQQHERLELVISDNASSDGTEEICRDFAGSDGRVRYRRQPENIGLLGNFDYVLAHARGEYFKWLGDDDWMSPSYINRTVAVLAGDPSTLLVTTQQSFLDLDGSVATSAYDAARLRSHRPVERFEEMLRLLNESHLLLDPLYGLMRRPQITAIPRVRMLHEDEILAAKLALAGRFGHVEDVLSYRRFKPFSRRVVMAQRLGVPAWQARMATTLQCRELFRAVADAELTPAERRQADAAILRFYLERQARTIAHRSRKLLRMASGHRAPPSTSGDGFDGGQTPSAGRAVASRTN